MIHSNSPCQEALVEASARRGNVPSGDRADDAAVPVPTAAPADGLADAVLAGAVLAGAVDVASVGVITGAAPAAGLPVPTPALGPPPPPAPGFCGGPGRPGPPGQLGPGHPGPCSRCRAGCWLSGAVCSCGQAPSGCESSPAAAAEAPASSRRLAMHAVRMHACLRACMGLRHCMSWGHETPKRFLGTQA